MTSLSFDHNPRRKRVVTYIVLGGIFLILLILGLATFRTARNNIQAERKATQLQDQFRQAGLPVPSTSQITGVLGTDGGAMCHDPGGALYQAEVKAQMVAGAGGPGQRPTTVDERVVQGAQIAIGIYCPDKLDDFNKFVDGLKFDNVQGG